MSEPIQTPPGDTDVQVVIEGLRKNVSRGGREASELDEESFTERIALAKTAPVSDIWRLISGELTITLCGFAHGK